MQLLGLPTAVVPRPFRLSGPCWSLFETRIPGGASGHHDARAPAAPESFPSSLSHHLINRHMGSDRRSVFMTSSSLHSISAQIDPRSSPTHDKTIARLRKMPIKTTSDFPSNALHFGRRRSRPAQALSSTDPSRMAFPSASASLPLSLRPVERRSPSMHVITTPIPGHHALDARQHRNALTLALRCLLL